MLQKLYIRNYAIIEELSIDFQAHLSVITGETGAGKSIILGALSLILGDRADTSVLINRQEKCIVEATFETRGNEKLERVLRLSDLDVEERTIIRREINTSGKSRAFVNDTPVTLQTLHQIADLLVDLHRQFDQTALRDNAFLYEVVDAVSENQQVLAEYQRHYQRYLKIRQQLAAIEKQQQEWRKEADYKQFLFDELAEAGFREEEIEDAEQRMEQLGHAEQIKTALAAASAYLDAEETGANSLLRRAVQQIDGISAFFPKVTEAQARLESALIELKDLASEIAGFEADFEVDDQELSRLQERMDLAYRLLKKHQVQTTAELLAVQSQLESDLQAQMDLDGQIGQLKHELEIEEARVRSYSEALSERRLRRAPEFAQEVNRLLHLIGMPNARLSIRLTNSETFHDFGSDQIAFLWDANNSGQFQEVHRSASGGELSRLMLCLKTLTAKALRLPTLIFDEVDTGISGEAARQVGILLKRLGDEHQVLSITHQPQVAAKGRTHFYVYKTEEGGRVQTKIRRLEEAERVDELAKMIGGDQPTAAALKNAEELMQNG